VTKNRSSKKIVPQPGHQSLKALPKLKGSYYRRVKDIDRALEEIEYVELPPVAQFLCLYFGCEKLALAIMGVDAKLASEDAYGRGKFVLLNELKSAIVPLRISVAPNELDLIFGPSKTSARELRHKVVHDFGPSNIKAMKRHCATHIPIMTKFLDCIPEFHEYQRKNF
jgi:hypothetical protein